MGFVTLKRQMSRLQLKHVCLFILGVVLLSIMLLSMPLTFPIVLPFLFVTLIIVFIFITLFIFCKIFQRIYGKYFKGTLHGDPEEKDCGDEVSEEYIEELVTPQEEPILVVQIYTPQNSGEVFINELMEHIHEDDEIKLEFEKVHSVLDIEVGRPLLIVCMNNSRIGTDAKNSIKGIQESIKQTAVLLVFHHKGEHALPSQPSVRRLVESEFKSLHGIYDVACLTGQGVYPCEMNTTAISSIIEFLRSYKHKEYTTNII